MRIAIPEFSMVILIGPSGCGKSTFAQKHFLPSQILSSDTYRGLVSDDEDSLEATTAAFEALHFMLAKRLELGRLTVVDATNVQKESRKPLLSIAGRWHALKVAIILDVPERICLERNALRPNRQFGAHVVRNQRNDLRRTFSDIRKEGWHKVYVLRPEEIEAAEIVLEPLWSRRPEQHGPFDIIGDVHGCYAELLELLARLGWSTEQELTHPENRKLVFVGDLVDRGPNSTDVLKLVMRAVAEGRAICVPGNHDIRLARALGGGKVSLTHGLSETLAELEVHPPEFRQQVMDFITGLVSHVVMDDGKLCVAHAGLPAEMQGRGSKAVRDFALYGETTGEIDEFGLPVRYEWAKNYRGKAAVVFGHTPVPRAQWFNNTINIDTGCCFGGSLTALRYPEREIVSVPAHRIYCEPAKPIGHIEQEEEPDDGLLDLADVLGRRSVETGLAGRITIREENAIAALEVMSRFACDPRWLIYLPPTMSPCATSQREGFLEYPTEAFGYYESHGVEQVVCQEKHMGSRAVAVICRSSEVAGQRFSVETGERGIITTRTGRRFFEDIAQEQELVHRVAAAAEKSGLFAELQSDWILLDAELMPWSAKAVGLLRQQYAPVGAAAVANAALWGEVAAAASARALEGADDLVRSGGSRSHAAHRFRDAYRRYCWSVNRLEDYKLAPFHLLASEHAVHHDKTHGWHLETLGRLCAADPEIMRLTLCRVVNLASEREIQGACEWWENFVSGGGEGIVVKPMSFVSHHEGRLVQPAIKCRGPEYLRIIYGPDYLEPANLDMLRRRGLSRKRGLASREFALGIEAMHRFIRREPLRRVHECVFGVLALESESVDPRL